MTDDVMNPALPAEQPVSSDPVERIAEGSLTTWLDKVEAPTWALIVAVYLSLGLLTYYATALPVWLLVPLAAVAVCWYSHLQHELVHGHPTRNSRFNTLFGLLPFTLYMPYSLYKKTHLLHHATPALTDPDFDTESYFVSQEYWDRASAPVRWLLVANQSMLGRFVLGPFLMYYAFWKEELLRMVEGDFSHAGDWLLHFVLVGALLSWTSFVCGLSVPEYIFYFAIPGASLGLLRSYAEHRPGPSNADRTAIIESSWFIRLLFLNNNLHAIHHTKPNLAWYKINRDYRANKDSWLTRNGGYFYKDYLQLAKSYFFRPKAHPVHPGY